MAVEVNELTQAHTAWVLLHTAGDILLDLGGEWTEIESAVTDAQNDLRDLINENNQ